MKKKKKKSNGFALGRQQTQPKSPIFSSFLERIFMMKHCLWMYDADRPFYLAAIWNVLCFRYYPCLLVLSRPESFFFLISFLLSSFHNSNVAHTLVFWWVNRLFFSPLMLPPFCIRVVNTIGRFQYLSDDGMLFLFFFSCNVGNATNHIFSRRNLLEKIAKIKLLLASR